MATLLFYANKTVSYFGKLYMKVLYIPSYSYFLFSYILTFISFIHILIRSLLLRPECENIGSFKTQLFGTSSLLTQIRNEYTTSYTDYIKKCPSILSYEGGGVITEAYSHWRCYLVQINELLFYVKQNAS